MQSNEEKKNLTSHLRMCAQMLYKFAFYLTKKKEKDINKLILMYTYSQIEGRQDNVNIYKILYKYKPYK